MTSGDLNTIFSCMSTENIKDEARRLLDRLPEDITWDQLMHEIYVRQSIQAGLAASKEERPSTLLLLERDSDCRP